MAGRRNDYVWNGTANALSMAGNGSALSDVTGQFGIAGTLMRCRGELLAVLDSPTDGDKASVACGIIRATEEQLAVGVTAVPNPSDDLDADWVWHSFVPLSFVLATGNAAIEGAGRIIVDSKAMRKFRQGEYFIIVVDNNSLAGTAAIDVTFGLRLLVAS